MHYYSKSAFDVEACRNTDEKYSKGVVGQSGRLGGVSPPNWDALASALSISAKPLGLCNREREKVHSRNVHPEVIAHLDKTNEGNKRKLEAKKEEDSLALQQKRQRNDGRSEALCYFQLKKEDEKIPLWSVLLFDNECSDIAGGGRDDGKVPS